MRPLIIPLGSYEDHGDLPADLDTRIASCVAARISRMCGAEVLPPMPYGFSPEHVPRAISLPASTYLEAISAIVRASGADPLLIVNGHGGNRPLLEAAMFELVQAGPRILLLDIWGYVSSYLGLGGAVIHAGPVEASVASACGVQPPGYSPVPADEVRRIASEASSRRPALSSAWRGSELPPPSRVYSEGLGEELVEGMASSAAGALGAREGAWRPGVRL